MTTRLLAVGALALALSAPGLAKSDTAAQVRLSHTSPIAARGMGFKPLEYVRVTLTVSSRRFVRGARASSAGAFTVVWRGVTLGSCDWRVTAVGGNGSRAAVHGDAAACQTSPFGDG